MYFYLSHIYIKLCQHSKKPENWRLSVVRKLTHHYKALTTETPFFYRIFYGFFFFFFAVSSECDVAIEWERAQYMTLCFGLQPYCTIEHRTVVLYRMNTFWPIRCEKQHCDIHFSLLLVSHNFGNVSLIILLHMAEEHIHVWVSDWV